MLGITIALLLFVNGAAQGAMTGTMNGTLEGYLLYIEYIQENDIYLVAVEDYTGEFYDLSLNPGIPVIIDTIPVSPADLRAGLEVYTEITQGQITRLEGYSTSQPGYVSPGSITRQGVVTVIDGYQIKVRLDSGQEETYALAPFTLATRDGAAVPLDVLYAGDRVHLYFDELNTTLVGRIEIQGDSILVSNIYRGQLEAVYDIHSDYMLTDVQVFRNGSWQDHQAMMKIPATYGLPVYLSGHQVPSSYLKYYRSKTIYVVGKNILGKESMDRMIIRNQYEYCYTGKVNKVNWYGGAFEMDNKQNFAFNEGSILIRNGRLQDQYALNSGSDVCVMADGVGGTRMANIIYILNEELNNSSIGQRSLLYGQIDLIEQDGFWLKDFYVLDDNEWQAQHNDRHLFYGSDSAICNTDEQVLLTPGEFWAGDYAIDEDSDYAQDLDLEDWFAYIYTDGDHVTAMAVREEKDALEEQRISTGTVQRTEDDELVGWNVYLCDARDWSNYKNQWMNKSETLRINLEEAVIIKNGVLAEAECLTAGDRLYLVRDDFRARVIIVK